MSAQRKPSASSVTQQIRRDLLTPVMALLYKAGISKTKLLSECKSAIRSASSSRLRIIHTDISHEVTGAVNRWLRDPDFLNSSGRPDDLSLKGKKSIGGLVKACGAAVSPKAALDLMLKFGVVQPVRSGKYRLVRRLMVYGHPKYMPFEPSFRFLTDAARVSTRNQWNSKRLPRLFWQCADNPKIEARRTKEFMQFAQQRGLSFMHEINDWLDEHECIERRPGAKSKKLRRLGVGFFGICE